MAPIPCSSPECPSLWYSQIENAQSCNYCPSPWWEEDDEYDDGGPRFPRIRWHCDAGTYFKNDSTDPEKLVRGRGHEYKCIGLSPAWRRWGSRMVARCTAGALPARLEI